MTIERIGKVSITTKKGYYYLRASLPQPNTHKRKSTWISTGIKEGELARARIKAKELDLEIDRKLLEAGMEEGVELGDDLDQLRAKLFGALNVDEVISEELKPVLTDALHSSNEIIKAGKGVAPGKTFGEKLLGKLKHGWHCYLEEAKKVLSPSTYQVLTVAYHFCTKEAEFIAEGLNPQTEEEFNHGFVARLIESRSKERVKRMVGHMNRVIAVIPGHPPMVIPGSHLPQQKKRRKAIDAFSAQERDTILRHLQSKQSTQELWQLAMLCFYTGCRIGEAVALEVSDVDLDSGRIRFHRGIYQRKNKVHTKEGLKTQAFRYFPINAQLEVFLKGRMEGRQEGRLLELTFNYGKGRKEWKKELEACGVRYRKPYAMRHTFITLCLGKGIPVATVAEWVGNSPAVIYQSYASGTKCEVPEL